MPPTAPSAPAPTSAGGERASQLCFEVGKLPQTRNLSLSRAMLSLLQHEGGSEMSQRVLYQERSFVLLQANAVVLSTYTSEE